MMNKLLLSILSLCTLLLVGCNNGDDGLLDTPTSTVDAISQLIIAPQQSSVPVGLSLQMKAEAIFASGNVVEVTEGDVIKWQTSDPTIASISNEPASQGLVSALVPGVVTITASLKSDGEVFEASTTLEVTNAIVTELVLLSASESLPVGIGQQYYAQALFSDNHVLDVTQDSAITWQSSDTSVATVSNAPESKGQVIALKAGEVIISAVGTANGQTFESSVTLMVTDAIVTQLIVEPIVSTLPVGLEQQYRATVVLSDNQTLDVTQDSAISWQSSDSSLATVSNSDNRKGLVTAWQEGEVTIRALGSANGQTFEASATLIVTDAVVSQLLVKPESSSLPVGFEQQFLAEVILSDNQVVDVTQDSVISWQSSDPSIATVSNVVGTKGQVTTHKVGEVTITASGSANGHAFQASATLNVTNAVVTEFFVEPAIKSLPVGLDQQYRAKVKFSDNQILDVTQDSAINWRVSDSNVVSVSNSTGAKGLVKALQVGEVTITASGSASGQNFEASATLNVTDAVVTELVVEPAMSTLPVGLEQQYSAHALLSNGQVLDVTRDSVISWRVSDSSFASVSNSIDSKGLVKALSVGEVTVIASGRANGQTFEASASLNVADAVVSTQIVAPSVNALPVGLEQQYSAQAVLSNGQVLDVTQDSAITWRVSDSNFASVSNSIDTKGLVKALAVGEVTVIASGSANGQVFKASAALTVTDPVLQEVTLSAPSITLVEYHDVQLRAYGHYSDGSSTEVTSLCSWDAGENVSAIGGLLSANPFVADYSTTVTATYQGVTSLATTVTMVEAEMSPVIGRETPYVSEISSDIHDELSFQGSAVLDGIYDAKSGELLAGGYGGGLNATDQELYSDHMFVNEVSFIKAIYGTAWGGSGGKPMLQVLEWQEGSVSKKVGKLYSGSSVEVNIEDRVLGVIVYSSSSVQPRYVTGIQFVYK